MTSYSEGPNQRGLTMAEIALPDSRTLLSPLKSLPMTSYADDSNSSRNICGASQGDSNSLTNSANTSSRDCYSLTNTINNTVHDCNSSADFLHPGSAQSDVLDAEVDQISNRPEDDVQDADPTPNMPLLE